jgi:hypothetical protein
MNFSNVKLYSIISRWMTLLSPLIDVKQEDREALVQLYDILLGPVQEDLKEILAWLDSKEPTIRFIFENNTSQDARYHA